MVKTHVSIPSRTSGDAGFGMIEIVVSMLLISLLAIAFLPMLVTSLRVSVSNTTMVSATQLVASHMEGVRALGSSCAELKNYPSSVPAVFDEDGLALHVHVVVTCPTAYPQTATVWISVVDDSTVDPIAEATTSIFVDHY